MWKDQQEEENHQNRKKEIFIQMSHLHDYFSFHETQVEPELNTQVILTAT